MTDELTPKAAVGGGGPAAAWAMPFPDSARDALVGGLAAVDVGFCLCDAGDVIRFVNAAFRASFCPDYDGRPADFVGVIGRAVRDGTGIKLVSASAADFEARVRERRRTFSGAVCFATDTVDGRWWWVSDTRLPDGGIMVVSQEISGLKRQELALRDAHASALVEARTDELTGIANRRQGLRGAGAAVAEARATGRGLALALLDIDHFKAINDRHGHDAGDRAIRHLALFLAGAVAPGQQLSRLGGDEFLLVAPGADPATLEVGLSAVIAAMPPLLLPGTRDGLRLSISVGVAALAPDEPWPDLVRRADRALYAAKAAGRGRIALAA